MPGYYDVYLNETGSVMIEINNEGSINLHNVFILVSGIPESSFSINPTSADILVPRESVPFTLYIFPQNLTSDTNTVTLMFISDEISETSSFLLEVKSTPSDAEDTIPIINSIIILLLVVIIASISILVVMLVLFKAKRCPLCGANLVKDYEGKNYVSFKCSTCKYYSYKIKKKT